jgi:AcrR family transcriptional regulator
MNGATDLALEDDSPVSRRRPGGRTERVRREVAEAVLDLFRAGRSDFSVAEVADRAGVHRSTVYRRWPTPADLVREALTLHTQDLHVPDTGSWEGDVAALARRLAKFFANPVEVSMNAALASGTSPEIDAVMIDHWKPLFSEMAAIVARASERGGSWNRSPRASRPQ